MKTFFQYSQKHSDITLNGVNVESSGISYYPDFYEYKDYYKSFIIQPKYQYRPDKIAYFLWTNQSLAWVLDAINNFSHVSEYYIGRSIFYLEEDFLINIGIL